MGRRNGSGATYVRLTRGDLKAWDARAWEIVRDAQEYGWTFRVSSRGHAIGRSPDGHTTMSVANKYDQKRSGTNARAEFERWLKQHRSQAAMSKKLQGAVTKIVGNLARDLITSYADKSPDDVPETVRVVLKRMADDDAVAAYMADRIAAGRGQPLILTNDLDTGSQEITEASKPWRIQWVMADPDDHHVVGFGGPNMDRDVAEKNVSEHFADIARSKALAKQAALDAATPIRKKEPAVKMYACDETGCDAVFEKPNSLSLHKLRKHAPMVACQWCGKDVRVSARHLHEQSCPSNPDHDATFVCERCDGQYKVTGRGRHESTCARYNPQQLASKRASNLLKRGLPLPADAPVGVRKAAVARRVEVSPAPNPAPAPDQPAAIGATSSLSAMAAALPHVADPLSALMNLLAEVEELRSRRPEDLRQQIEALTTERDDALKRAEEAEGKLATLKSVFG